LISRIFKWRVEFRYYAFAILAPIGLFALAFLLDRVVTGTWSDLRLLGEADYMPVLGPFGVLGLWLLTYGFGEETGWRAPCKRNRLPQTQLILALLWATCICPPFSFAIMLIGRLVSSVCFLMIYSSLHWRTIAQVKADRHPLSRCFQCCRSRSGRAIWAPINRACILWAPSSAKYGMEVHLS
jgi:hypothetical protein